MIGSWRTSIDETATMSRPTGIGLTGGRSRAHAVTARSKPRPRISTGVAKRKAAHEAKGTQRRVRKAAKVKHRSVVVLPTAPALAPAAPVLHVSAPYEDPRSWVVAVQPAGIIEHMRFGSKSAAEDWIATQPAALMITA